jgi:RimJ/RimL family protein N-acetyltransferase
MSKRELSPFELGPVRLRLLAAADLPKTLQWRNQDHIRRWFFFSDIITAEQHQAWFEKYQDRDDDFVFVIEECTPSGFRPVGQIAIYHVDWEALSAEYGRVMIGEADAAGKGLAKAATQAVLRIAFEQLGLREVYLEVLADNTRAIALYESTGFVTQSVIEHGSSKALRMHVLAP